MTITRKISILFFAALALSCAACCQAAGKPISITFLGVSLNTIAQRIVNFLLSITGSIALLFLIASGIRYMISTGNSDSQQKAKGMLAGTLQGLFVILFAYMLLSFVDKLLTQ